MPTLDPTTGKPLSGARKRAMKAAKATEAAKHDETWPSVFLARYAATGMKYKSAKFADVSIRRVRQLENDDPAFKERVEDAKQEFIETCQEALFEQLTKKNNALAGFGLLKKLDPENWDDKLRIEATHKHQVDRTPLPVAEIEEILRQAALAAQEARRALPDPNIIDAEIIRKDAP